MKINKLNLTLENLFLVDQFFKIQYIDNKRYGEMGYFYWKLLKNKINNGFINCYRDEDKIIATTSITPKEILYKSKQFIAAEIGDTYVDQNFQGRGFFSNLVNKSKKDAEDYFFIYGLPNHLALPIHLKRCNFRLLNFFEVYSFIYPLSIKKFLSKKISKIPAFILDIFYKLYVRSQINLARVKYYFSNIYTYEQIDIFDESFDKFWDKASIEWDFIFVRNKKMLSWRFDENPKKYNKLIFKKDNIIIGYLVYANSYEDDSRIIIADFLFLREYDKAFDYAIHLLKNIALKRNINGISLWYTLQSGFTKNLFKNNFYKNKIVPVIFDNRDNYKMECNNVHFTISDSDNI